MTAENGTGKNLNAITVKNQKAANERKTFLNQRHNREIFTLI